jgi:drug/metabolite transporter (DMT)-like permease
VTSPPQTHDGARHNAALGITLRVLAMACFACLSATVKWAGTRGIGVFEIVFFRNAFAFLPLTVHIWRAGGVSVLRTSRPLGHLTRSAIGLVAMTCGFSALQRLPLSEATAFQFASPLFMTALSALVLGEMVGRHRWAAVVVGFVGVLVMVRPLPGHFHPVGVAFALAGAAGAAGAAVTIRQIAATERGPAIVFYFTLAGALMGLAGSAGHWVTPDPKTLAILILGGVIGGLGQILHTEALSAAPVGVVAPFDYTQLVWATALGFLIWGELPGRATLVGAAIVAASGLYILHREVVRYRAARAAATSFPA